ncbi:MAG: cupin domain-containing protein [Bacillota bacterium]
MKKKSWIQLVFKLSLFELYLFSYLNKKNALLFIKVKHPLVIMNEVQDKEHIIHAGDSIKFRADNSHSYSNPGKELTNLTMIVYYPQS